VKKKREKSARTTRSSMMIIPKLFPRGKERSRLGDQEREETNEKPERRARDLANIEQKFGVTAWSGGI